MPETDGLVSAERRPSFVVEIAGSVKRIELGPDAVAFLAGQVDGVRTSSGDLRPVLSPGDLALTAADPAASAERLEGCFVLVVIGPGDRCWVGSDGFGRADVYLTGAGPDRTIATDVSLLPRSATAVPDQAAWAHTLVAYGYRPPKRHTLYSGVTRLGVGEHLSVVDGRPTLGAHPFRAATAEPLDDRALNAYADRLIDAVRVRGSRHGNVVFLSSGWDSTAILACLVHCFGRGKVRAVIGRMRYAERSGIINQFELDRAKAIADYYGVRLDVIEFDYANTAPAQWDQVRSLFREHHIASITGLNHFLLSDYVAKTTGGDETIFAGEISDGAHNLGFSQFVTIFHPTQAFREYADKMASYLFGPTFLAQLQAGTHESDAVYALMRARLGSTEFDAPGHPGAPRTRQLLSSFFLRGTRFPLCSLKNTRVLTAEGISHYTSAMEQSYLAPASEEATGGTLYAWYLHLYNSFHWQGSTVATLALTAAAHGLRVALPFWDRGVQESLSSMPEDAGRGLDFHPTKYPLKWTLQHRLDYPFHLQQGPHSYIYDVDPSFSHSAELLYGSSFAPYFGDALSSRPHRDVLDSRLFDVGYLEEVIARYLNGDEVRGAELNDLMALALTASVGWYGH